MIKRANFKPARILFLILLVLNTILYAAERKDLYPIRGVTYSPTPSDYFEGKPVYFDSDFANDSFKALWGPFGSDIGRKDLKVFSTLNINFVRLYDWNPQNKHLGFLDTANKYGIKVIVPISNFFLGLIRDNDPNAKSLITEIVSEVIINGKLHPAVSIFAIGNEYELNSLTAEHVAKAAEYVIEAQLNNGITIENVAFISAPVSFAALNGKPAAIDQLTKVRDAFNKNNFLNNNNIYQTKYIANVNTFNPGSDLTVFLEKTFKEVFPDGYIIFTELGKEIGGNVQTEDQQAAFVKDQVIAALTSKNEKALGSTVFQYINKDWKKGTEATFGMTKFTPSPSPKKVENELGTYLVDSQETKPLYDAILNVYSNPPNPDLVISESNFVSSSKQSNQPRASNTAINLHVSLDPGSYDGEKAEWFLMHYGPQGLSVYDLEQGWIDADSPLIAHVGSLINLNNLQLNGKTLQPGFHTFIFGIDLRTDDDLVASKTWHVDIETILVE